MRQGKVFDIELDTADKKKAEAALKNACERLLANTVIENFRIERPSTSSGQVAA